jgi:hypothetical protein
VPALERQADALRRPRPPDPRSQLLKAPSPSPAHRQLKTHLPPVASDGGATRALLAGKNSKWAMTQDDINIGYGATGVTKIGKLGKGLIVPDSVIHDPTGQGLVGDLILAKGSRHPVRAPTRRTESACRPVN